MERVRLNADESAKYLKCSYGMFCGMVRSKQVPHFRIGNRVFCFQDSLDRYMENLEAQSMQPDSRLKIAK
jgi:hypothetical protein